GVAADRAAGKGQRASAVDAAAVSAGRLDEVAADSAASHYQRASAVDATAAVGADAGAGIAADRAAVDGHGQRAGAGDAAAHVGGAVAADGAVVQRQTRAALVAVIEDAAA